MQQDYFIQAAINPEWDKATKVHDWRNYVPENIRAMWETFTIAQRIALVQWADDIADNEYWD